MKLLVSLALAIVGDATTFAPDVASTQYTEIRLTVTTVALRSGSVATVQAVPAATTLCWLTVGLPNGSASARPAPCIAASNNGPATRSAFLERS